MNVKRSLVVIGIFIGLLILWGIGYIMASQGIVTIYSAGILENSFWNGFFLILIIGILFVVIGFLVIISKWIFSGNQNKTNSK